MDSNFTVANARECRSVISNLIKELAEAAEQTDLFYDECMACLSEISRVMASQIFTETPIAELDCRDRGLPEKKLLDAGILTLQDLYELSDSQLSYVADLPSQQALNVFNRIHSEFEQLAATGMIDIDKLAGSEQLSALLVSLYKYRHLEAYDPTIQSFNRSYLTDLSAAVEEIVPRSNRLKWIFTSARDKKDAEDSYAFLYSFTQGTEFKGIQDILRKVKKIQQITEKEATVAFHDDHNGVVADLNTLLSGRFGRDENEKPFTRSYAQQVIDDLRYVIDSIDECKEKETQYKEQILQAGQKLIATESVEQLKSIPIDEINRGKQGFRISALRSAGYENVFDVYAASEWNLAAIRGISADTAYAMKAIARKIAQESSQTVKIKLNRDRKTVESTALIQAVSQYRTNREAISELAPAQKKENIINHGILQLYRGIDSVEWRLLNEHEKQETLNALRALITLQQDSIIANAYQTIDRLHEAEAQSDADAWTDFDRNTVRFYNILEELMPDALGNGDSMYGLPEDLAKEIQEECIFPDGLLCELRRYQEWGVKYILHQEKVLLGDEMGLGKTVQAIASMVSLKNTGATHFVVVCPASVISNWCREIRKHSKLPVVRVHGLDRKESLRDWIKRGGVAVTTYETTGYFTLEEDFKFSMLIVDEAHYIKNPEARRTQNVKEISRHAERMLFMTGTALENKVEEMVALITMLQPQIAASIKSMMHLSSAPKFREVIAPVYYRRKREDVLTELPELIENEEWCTLSGVEEEIYENDVLAKKFAQARRVSWTVNDLKDSSKAKMLREIIEDAKAEDRKVIVFSYFLDTIRKIHQYLGDICTEPINGSVPPARRQDIIDNFDSAPAGTVLLAQIQAGGTGLNIQSASVVVLCEPQFKPSIENQAISRAYRMGQTRNVLVYRLLCEESVDEKIMNILHDKQKLFDAFADESVAAKKSIELDDKAFGNIIKEEIDRINAKRSA